MWSLCKRLLVWLHLLELLRGCLRSGRRTIAHAIVWLTLLLTRGWGPAYEVRGLSVHHLLLLLVTTVLSTPRFARLRFTVSCTRSGSVIHHAAWETTLCCCLLLSTVDAIDNDSVIEGSTVGDTCCSFRMLTVLDSKLESWLRVATLCIVFEHLPFFRSSKQHFRLTLITSNDIEFFDSPRYIFRNSLDLRCLLRPCSFS